MWGRSRGTLVSIPLLHMRANSSARFQAASLAWLALALLAAATPAGAAQARSQPMQFRHLGIDDGLPSSQVTSVLRDRRGFMWIGTAHGVSRYDSHRFRTYGDQDEGGLPEGLVRQIYEDASGEIWVVTPSGLSRYSTAIDAFVTFPSSALGESGGPPPELTCVAEDAAGRLIVGSSRGLLVVDKAAGTAARLPLKNPNGEWTPLVNALHLDGRGRLWVGTDSGLFAVDSVDGNASYWPHVMGRADGSDSIIRALATDKQGDLWIGTGYAGIARFNADTGTFTRYQHAPDEEDSPSGNRIARIIAERDGPGVWFAIENGGVDRFDPHEDRFAHVRNDAANPHSLGSNAVWALYQDPDGLLWVGTFSAGLNVSMPNGVSIRHYRSLAGDPQSLSNNAVSGFLVDGGGRIWVTTDGGGLNRLDPVTGRFEWFSSANTNLDSDAVLSVAQSRNGELWVSTWAGGISRFDPSTRRFIAYTTKNSDIPNDNVYEVMVDRAGEVWVGTDNGQVARLDRGRGTFTQRYRVVPEEFKWSSVLMLRELSDGRFAVGLREGGLTILDPRSGAQDHYLKGGAAGRSIASNQVRAIHESGANVLWVGTDAGLDRLDLRTGAREHIGAEEGLSSRFVDGIVSDKAGLLWISTDKGLSRFDPASKRFRTFTRADGLQSNEFLMRAAYAAPDGTLFFGGNNGFNIIRPDQIVSAKTSPVVVLTDLLLFNKPVRPGDKASALPASLDAVSSLQLAHEQNVITFQFTALEYRAPGAVRYAYRLDGFDVEWQEARDKREATYTNLAPGRYAFRVRASDIDGAWSTEAVALQLSIKPALWQTWWVRLLVALCAAASLTWIWRFQHKRRMEIELARHALNDPLTGLATRLLLEDRISSALERHARAQAVTPQDGSRKSCTALMYVDLNKFKAVNDSMGHHAGDQLLKVVASRLVECTRGSDTVARIGGDEFAVLLEELRREDNARLLANRIVESVQLPIKVGDAANRREVTVGASIGIAFVEPGLTREELQKRADAAMYQAKQTRVGVVVFAGSSN